MSVIDRIKSVNQYAGISVRQFCIEVGIANGYLDKVKDVGSEKLLKILNRYPEISPEWLLTGKGPMLKAETERKIKVHRIHMPPYREKNQETLVPLYNIDAAANLKTIFDNKKQNIIDTIRIPDLPRCDGAIYIRGDSMYPLLKSGDIVIYKEISDFDNLIFGEMYLIDFSISDDDFLVVKYVKRSNIEEHIQLVSYNIHHDPIDIPSKCIRAMALIKASVRINTMM